MDEKDEKVKTEKKNSIVKPSGTIQISMQDISLVQRKAWNLLLFNARHDLTVKPIHTMPVAELANALGYHDIKELRRALIKLQKIVLEFNVLGDRDKSVWETMSLLAGARIIDGKTLEYEYGAFLTEKLLNTDAFTRMNLMIQTKFKTKYALVLYEMALDHYIPAQGRGQTPWIELPDLRKLLGCEGTVYNDFRYLNRILKKAIAEVNGKSDILVDYTLRRNGRFISKIKFTIVKNPAASQNISRAEQAEMPLAPGGELYEILVGEFRIVAGVAKDIVQRYSEDRIRGGIAEARVAIARGGIENAAGMVVSMIKEGYTPDGKRTGGRYDMPPPRAAVDISNDGQEPKDTEEKYEATPRAENRRQYSVADIKEGMSVQYGDKIYTVGPSGTISIENWSEADKRMAKETYPARIIVDDLNIGRAQIVE